MKIIAAITALASMAPASAGLLGKKQDGEGAQRRLNAYHDCVGKTVEECTAIIHAIDPDKEVVVIEPRNPNEDQYYTVGIPCTSEDIETGQVDMEYLSQHDDPYLHYPHYWEGDSTEGTRRVGPWNCLHMTCDTCCHEILFSVPDLDVNGNHLSCRYIVNDPNVVKIVLKDGKIYNDPCCPTVKH